MCARHLLRLRNRGCPVGSTVIRFLVRLPSPFPRPGLILPERCAGSRSRLAKGHRLRRAAALMATSRNVPLGQDGRQGSVFRSLFESCQRKPLDALDSRSVLKPFLLR
jgi:hypothetical protein